MRAGRGEGGRGVPQQDMQKCTRGGCRFSTCATLHVPCASLLVSLSTLLQYIRHGCFAPLLADLIRVHIYIYVVYMVLIHIRIRVCVSESASIQWATSINGSTMAGVGREARLTLKSQPINKMQSKLV